MIDINVKSEQQVQTHCYYDGVLLLINVNLLKLDAPKGNFIFKTNSTSEYTSNFLLDNGGLDIGHDTER